jgi:hypothetical protein
MTVPTYGTPRTGDKVRYINHAGRRVSEPIGVVVDEPIPDYFTADARTAVKWPTRPYTCFPKTANLIIVEQAPQSARMPDSDVNDKVIVPKFLLLDLLVALSSSDAFTRSQARDSLTGYLERQERHA